MHHQHGAYMENLFEAVARNRPEWLAQGIFIRAVTTEPEVRALLLGRLGWDVSPEEVPKVDEEQVTKGGWRADVCVTWQQHAALIELKLLAGFTTRQKEAIDGRRVHLAVVPSIQGRNLPEGLVVLTWEEVAARVKEDDLLRRLLNEVSASSTWLLENLPQDELQRDFSSFVEERSAGSWRHLYRFLSTVHLHLRHGAPEYHASEGWSYSRSNKQPYYGFCFWLGETPSPSFWLGIWRRAMDGKLVFGLTVTHGRGTVLLEAEEQCSATQFAERVLDEARAYCHTYRSEQPSSEGQGAP